MPSTYSTDLRIELIANGEKSGTWGTITNDNLGVIIEDAISGLASVTVISANQALTAQDGAVDQARCAAISLSTTTGADFAVYVPPVTKLYVITNPSGYTATVYCSTAIGNTTAAGTGVAIPTGKSVLIRADGIDVVEQLSHVVGAFSVGGNLSVTGNAVVTGTTTLSDDLILNGSSGTAGQVVISQGAGTYPVWGTPTTFVAGMIMLWSGTIATIPSGWLLCNGSSGTPDLRDRFIVGASSDDSGVAKTNITGSLTQTGGTKDAVIVSHTHTATVTDPGHFHNYYRAVAKASYDPGGEAWTSESFQATSTATTGITVANSTEGVSGTNANLPPYYALAYIMKA